MLPDSVQILPDLGKKSLYLVTLSEDDEDFVPPEEDQTGKEVQVIRVKKQRKKRRHRRLRSPRKIKNFEEGEEVTELKLT